MLADTGESEPILSMGDDVDVDNSTVRYLFITASGSDRILRVNVATTGLQFTEVYWQALDAAYNKISSTLYIAPYFYFGTFEPNAQLGRIHTANFCNMECDVNSFCLNNNCQCMTGYAKDPSQLLPGGQPSVSLSSICRAPLISALNCLGSASWRRR